MKAPKSITNTILYLSSNVREIWWYLKYPSRNEYASHLAIVFSTSYVNGNGKWSFLVATFNFLKFAHILSFPFFFDTTIIDDN